MSSFAKMGKTTDMHFESPEKRAEKLLSLICQGGSIKVEQGQIWISPPELAKRLAPQIRENKKALLLALGYCPACATELIKERRDFLRPDNPKNHIYCPSLASHYDRWESGTFTNGEVKQ